MIKTKSHTTLYSIILWVIGLIIALFASISASLPLGLLGISLLIASGTLATLSLRE